MHVAPGSNASAETAGDFVVAQINMRTTRRADCRSRRATDLLFSFTIKTLDDGTALSLPKILESAKNGGSLRRGRFFSCAQFQARLRREWQKRAAALATDRAFGRSIFHLLKAAVRAFRTDFYKRRIGHWTLSRDPFLMRALQTLLSDLPATRIWILARNAQPR